MIDVGLCGYVSLCMCVYVHVYMSACMCVHVSVCVALFQNTEPVQTEVSVD